MNILETTLKTRLIDLIKGTILFLSIPPALIWLARLGYSLEWTGFGTPVEGALGAKTLWDWMDLLLLPMVLAGGALLLNRSGRETDRACGTIGAGGPMQLMHVTGTDYDMVPCDARSQR